MPGTLTFEITEDLKRIIEHTRRHPNCRVAYSQEQGEPSLFLVKDQGVYLMSASEKALLRNPENKDSHNLVVYAKECDPATCSFEEWYEAARRICGGDDFAENVDLKVFEEAIAAGYKKIRIALTGKTMRIRAGMR